MGNNKNNFWNEAGKGGLILACVAIAYFFIQLLVGKGQDGGAFVKVMNFVLWAGKFALCIWLMARLLRAEATDNGADRRRTFRFGMAVAFLSALIYAGFYMFYVSVIDTDFFKEAFDAMAAGLASQLPSDQIDAFMNMESSMPVFSFVGNLIWCFLIGTIISAIVSNKYCAPSNPFED
ncbi:MAG: DUF4199 domain-containing protein [Bacteroidales bacterium]|nr:DUF4199 domain-containing protein [Bacteroidales bacterium]